MKSAMILQLFIIYLSTNQLLGEQVAELPAILDSFLLAQPIPVALLQGEGWVGSHEVVGKGYIFTKTSQMASIDVIFTSTYHTKQLNPWPNSSASRLVNYSQLSPCQGDMQPFEGDPDTRGRLTSLRNKPQQKHPGQLLASIPVSQPVQPLFDCEKCVLLLCTWKPGFLKSGHNFCFKYQFVYFLYQLHFV